MAAAPLLAQAGGQAAGLANTLQITGRRKLGKLEVSRIGLGVQNMSRNDQTTVPNRAEMHNIIRTAYDCGLTGRWRPTPSTSSRRGLIRKITSRLSSRHGASATAGSSRP